MKPDVDRLLEVGAVALMTQLGPGLATAYEQSNAGALGALLLALREEFERGAARRIEENDALRALFARAVDVVDDTALAKKLRSASEKTSEAFEISALEQENAALRGLLIELHAHAESLLESDRPAEADEADSEATRTLVEAIWSELARSTERRRLAMAVF